MTNIDRFPELGFLALLRLWIASAFAPDASRDAARINAIVARHGCPPGA